MYRIALVKNKEEWEKFVLSQDYALFVQSYNYGKFYESLGEQFWIFGIYKNMKLIGGSLVVSVHAKRGNFLYLPYGPILPKNKNQALLMLIKTLKELCKKEKYDFIRVSPFIENSQENKILFSSNGFRPAPIHMLAETTWILDISPSEEKLLQAMKKNHRNLIRRCEREGVEIKTSEYVTESFHKLFDETARRHKFHRFSKKYVNNEFAAFSKSSQALLLSAYLPQKQLDSSAVIMFYGNMACYRHSASLNLDKRLPTSYLIQWRAIQKAKKRGVKYYNFWGIAPNGSSPKHPFYGITHFKKGFGGFQKELLHCQDLPISWKYSINWVIETGRSLKRGFK